MVDLSNNFWKDYPELRIPEAIASLYEKDKSKDKIESSQIMWAIHLSEHPESNFYNNPDKRDVLAKSFLKDEKFKWESYQKVINEYKATCFTPAEQALVTWDELMKMRDTSLKEMYKAATKDKDTDELVKLDKMLVATPKMFDDYKRVKKDFEDEKTHKKGSKISSISDEDVI
tara:strand:- start:810 stop:1328 length:519 start_codon:yes stop_codon:yes gene_type:complete